MSLLGIVSRIIVTVVVMLAITAWLVIGPERLRAARSSIRTRVRVTAPYLVLLLVTLAVEKVARNVGPELSWVIGLNVTGLIYLVEGAFVARLQHLSTPWLTAYFSFAYLEGYVFLLVFPLLAYLALPNDLELKRTTIAYAVNYSIGLVCYVLIIAYGPRNLIPDAVQPLLYSTSPSAQLLTSEVNTNTNVFPSLHTSLATTVAVMAYRTRDVYPGWFLLATPLAASVAVSTMYLGIHWAVDVVGGVLLGVGSVYLADAFLHRRGVDASVRWGEPA